MKKKTKIRLNQALIFIYLKIMLITGTMILINQIGSYPDGTIKLLMLSSYFGFIGGILYLLRAMYLNICVWNQWKRKWNAWYIIRPFISALCGLSSTIFLKAGLFVLESNQSSNASLMGFYAFAFIAGMNSGRYLEKVESVAQSVFGIEQSRVAKKREGKS